MTSAFIRHFHIHKFFADVIKFGKYFSL